MGDGGEDGYERIDPSARTTGSFAFRLVRTEGHTVLAACDAELLGRTFAEGETILEVRPSFYDGDRTDEAGLVRLFLCATVGNLVGPRCVGLAIGRGIVDPGCILRVEGVPHVQWMLFLG